VTWPPGTEPTAPWGDVRRIAVLRGGGLGDLAFVLPAVEALRAAYPQAEVVLLGSAMGKALFADRPSPFERIEVLPVHPGVHGQGPGDPAVTEEFCARRREERFDLAVQLHGGGRNSNPFLLRLGARHTAGTATPDAPRLERTLPYVYYQHEVLRALEVAALAGAPTVHLEPVLRLSPGERASRSGRTGKPLVAVHPGASDPRRRWPAECFAEVAARLAESGVEVVVIGDEFDAEAAEVIVDRAHRRPAVPPGSVRSLAGQVPLAELVGFLAGVDLVLANDSGPRHLAQAVGTPTVGIFWFGNVVNAAPLSRGRHRIQISWTTHCPECGMDATMVGWTAERCEHDPSFVADVRIEAVYEDVVQLLSDTGRAR
jgi:ADP-heptose:LPS heptosyltransferase